ncbi:MAG: phosphotransferase, partial [Thermomicrobiaceae bacterium]|nr:phosphotransferase [Thermomicrobiaceae bacterium]
PVAVALDRQDLYGADYVVALNGARLVLHVGWPDAVGLAAERVAYEFQVLEMLEPYRIAPTPVLVDLSQRVVPCPLLVREYVPGHPVSSASDLVAAVEALAALHALPVDDALGLERVEPPLQASLARAHALVERYRDSPHADPVVRLLLQTVDRHLARSVASDAALFEGADRVIVHGDARPENVLIEFDVPRLVAWHRTAVDHPAADLCRLLVPMPGSFIEALDRRQMMEALVETYARVSPREVDVAALGRAVAARYPYAVLEVLAEAAAALVADQEDPSSPLGREDVARLSDLLSPGYIRSLLHGIAGL